MENLVKALIEKRNDTVDITYKLTKDYDFETWWVLLQNELVSKNLSFELAKTSGEINRKIRNVILGRLDEKYLTKVLRVADAKEMVDKLRGFRLAERNPHTYILRKQFHALPFNKGDTIDGIFEKVQGFVNDFQMVGKELKEDEIFDQNNKKTFLSRAKQMLNKLKRVLP